MVKKNFKACKFVDRVPDCVERHDYAREPASERRLVLLDGSNGDPGDSRSCRTVVPLVRHLLPHVHEGEARVSRILHQLCSFAAAGVYVEFTLLGCGLDQCLCG
jgi:hypothetical protein